jgi:DNA-binding transcriptional ArsR family regulator
MFYQEYTNIRIIIIRKDYAMGFDKNREYCSEAEIFKVLGHPVRLKIVVGLCSKECNVKHIWECLDLPQATVSQHLALLKNKGIIEGKRDGVKVRYSVVHPLAIQIVKIMDREADCASAGHHDVA